MNDSIHDLIQGIFNTFLFVMSVMFSILLLGVVTKRSVSMDAAGYNRAVYVKMDVYDKVYTIKGSSVLDTICKIASEKADVLVRINGEVLSRTMLDGMCTGETKAIVSFYQRIYTDKEYKICFNEDSKVLDVAEEDG